MWPKRTTLRSNLNKSVHYVLKPEQGQTKLRAASTRRSELESRRVAVPPPTFHAPEKRGRSKTPLLVTVAVILVAAALYAPWTAQPSFRNLVTYEYGAVLRRIVELRTKRQAIAPATPVQPPPHAAQGAAAPLAPPSAAQTVEAADTTAANSDSTADLASTSAAVADAKASPRAASLQDVKRDDGASSTAAVPALVPATSTTQRASTDTSTEPVVLPENVADDRVLRRVHPGYPKRAQQKRVLDLEEKVAAAVKKLKESGLVSPYLRSFVVARINPLLPAQRAALALIGKQHRKILAKYGF
jgi:hypothetical protein